MRAARLLTVLDLAGTFVFSIEGSMAGVRNQLDILGIVIIGFSSSLGGGIIRDVLLGATPPPAIRDWRYPAVAFLGSAIAFAGAVFINHIPPLLLITLDALGLSLFAVAGTEKALDYNMAPMIAICLGAVSGTGGGCIRDVLLTQVPAILRVDVYATAALAGALVMVIARKLKAPPVVAAFLGAASCFGLRMVAVWQGWNLPKAIDYTW